MASPKNTVTAFQEFLQHSKVVEALINLTLISQIGISPNNLVEASLANAATSNDKVTSPIIVPNNNSRPKSQHSSNR